MSAVTFDVLGLPAPQGSKTPIVRAGRAILVEGRDEAARDRFASWRDSVANAAREAAQVEGDDFHDGPLGLDVTFRFPMPKSRPAKVKRDGIGYKASAPDLDKLVRAVGDALKAGGLIGDDAQFARLHAIKFEVLDSWTGARITVSTLSP